VTNRLQERLAFLQSVLVDPLQLKGWVNGDLYLPTSERLGILPVPKDVQISSGMAEFNPNSTTDKKKQCYDYLAQMQGTRKAILPVHTPAELHLFHKLMETNPAFNSQSTGPVWKLALKVWNECADTQDGIYYKVCLLSLSYISQ